ncbi:MAG TPA: NTP transferase domain-containing protein [Marmoricola sp.]|nr:NTP transferase domain-containing protein [Marmoricola sp.]
MASGAATDTGAVVLTGGRAVRLDGADKATIELGGVTLLERVLAALDGIDEVVVVGDEVGTSRPVTWLREDPPGGGPAAALLAGLCGFPRTPRWVVVLAVDLPLVTTGTVLRLRDACGPDGALLVDEGGHRQLLCAVYRTEALLAAAPPMEQRPGVSVRSLASGLHLAEVDALPGEADDVDTWADLTALRERLQ